MREVITHNRLSQGEVRFPASYDPHHETVLANRLRRTNPITRSTMDIGTAVLGSGTETNARPDISRSAGAPQHSPYTNWKGKLPEGPVYV